MKIAIRIEVAIDYGETKTFGIFKLERPYRDLEPAKIGLSLAGGNHVLHEMQKIVVATQAEEVCTLRRFCTSCHRMLDLKERRIRNRVYATIRQHFERPLFICHIVTYFRCCTAARAARYGRQPLSFHPPGSTA
jgi:hypothetical protein